MTSPTRMAADFKSRIAIIDLTQLLKRWIMLPGLSKSFEVDVTKLSKQAASLHIFYLKNTIREEMSSRVAGQQ